MISVEYEVACQTIGQLIAHQADLIAIEESRADPDQAKLADAIAARAALIAARDALEPSDAAAIAKVLAEYGPRARALNG